MDNLMVFDTETTGLDINTNALLEIAFQVVDLTGKPVGKLMNTFVKYNKPIPEEATEVHKITLDMVENATPVEKVIAVMEKHCAHYNCVGLVAHNISFDIGTLDKYVAKDSTLRDLELVDTLHLSRRLFNDTDNHKLGTLCEHFELESDDFVGDYHSAGFDVAQTCELFKLIMSRLYDVTTFDELVLYHDTPIKLETMTFGKYKGVSMSKVPAYYKQWLNTIDLDIDLHYTLGLD